MTFLLVGISDSEAFTAAVIGVFFFLFYSGYAASGRTLPSVASLNGHADGAHPPPKRPTGFPPHFNAQQR